MRLTKVLLINLFQELRVAIAELKGRYFREMSHPIFDSSDQLKSLFEGDSYRKLFHKIAFESKAAEYYSIDRSGSFLFLDVNAKPTWLIVRSDKEIEEEIQLLEGYDSVESIVNQLRQREKILFLFSDKEYREPVANWEKFLFDAKKLNNTYYFSEIRHTVTNSIMWEKVQIIGCFVN